VVKTTGDGILIEFPSVVEAVSCAVKVQQGMVDRNVDVPEDKRITFTRHAVVSTETAIDARSVAHSGASKRVAHCAPCVHRHKRDQRSKRRRQDQ
jgi:adenylate cyclase